MATGTVKWFNQALADLGSKIHNLGSDVLKLAIVTNTVVPTANTVAPHFGGTGTTDFSANQVATTGTSYTGPITLTTVTWSLQSNIATLRADVVTIPRSTVMTDSSTMVK